MIRVLQLVLILLLPVGALAQSGLAVEHVWSRAAPQGGVGVLFMTVTDAGPPDRLLGVSTPVADRAELHESMNDNGVMKMRPTDKLPVSPGKPLVLAPGGYHVMLMGLKRALREGERFPVTLTFEKAGAVTIEALVARAGARIPAGHEGMAH
jgi:periplasmic copper chaperone A